MPCERLFAIAKLWKLFWLQHREFIDVSRASRNNKLTMEEKGNWNIKRKTNTMLGEKAQREKAFGNYTKTCFVREQAIVYQRIVALEGKLNVLTSDIVGLFMSNVSIQPTVKSITLIVTKQQQQAHNREIIFAHHFDCFFG